MKAKSGPSLWQRLNFAFTNSSYPFPPGGQNNDNVERNRDNPLRGFGDAESLILRLSTVFACVRLISGTISTLPFCIYERLPNGDVQEATDYPLAQLLSLRPNSEQTAQTFWQSYIASLLLRGAGYAQVDRQGNGRPYSIYFLDPRRTFWFRNADGTISYRYTPWNGQPVNLTPDNLFQTLAFTEDGQTPVSVIRQGASVFYSALSADMAANKTFEQGLMPTTYIKYPKVLKPDQREEARKTIVSLSGAQRAGEPIVLEADMDTGQIGINPVDAQLLESRAWSVEEICRWFGVPPHMVGHLDKTTAWGTGIEQNTIAFITYCLRYWLTAVEQSVSKSLIPPKDQARYYGRFNILALMRADSAGRAALYSSASQNGWMTRAEIRKMENLPFIEGSDVLTAQSNLLPLTDLGKQQSSPIVLQDALKNFLGMVQHGNGA
jgi:HK97 family phage portal protein